jgi:twinkle protein
MVKAGKEAELVSSCYNAGVPLSSGIKEYTLEDFEKIKKAPEFGLSTPYVRLSKLLRGWRGGTTVYIGAPEKAGKSTLVNEIGSHLMLNHQQPIFAVKPEEDEEGTLRRMAGSTVGSVFYDPEISIDPLEVDKAAALLCGKLFVLERDQTPRWDEVRQLMKEAFLSRGIKFFFIDPITNLSTGMSHADRDTFLHKMTREVAEDAKNYGYTVFLFCHLKTVKEGLSWGEGRVGTADDLAGSRAMAQACDVVIIMQAWMLTEGDDIDYLNRKRVLHVVREREYNSIGKVELLWNKHKGKLEEQEEDSDE